jgi:hypothetical protein
MEIRKLLSKMKIAPTKGKGGVKEKKKDEGQGHLDNVQRRFLQIAVLTAICLLLSAVSFLTSGVKLSKWSEASDLYLDCVMAGDVACNK